MEYIGHLFKHFNTARVAAITLPSDDRSFVDLALKVGVNEYRFVVYDITDDGKILWNSSKYITPCEDIVKLANSFIRQKSDILSNSMLSNAAQAILLRS